MKKVFGLSVTFAHGYLRQFILKKFLIASQVFIQNPEDHTKLVAQNTEYFNSDFKFNLIWTLFSPRTIIKNRIYRKISRTIYESPKIDPLYFNPLNESMISGTEKTFSIILPPLAYDECIPKRIFIIEHYIIGAKTIEAEMITIKGAIFGKVVVTSICISFKSEDRKSGGKYKLGSMPQNQSPKKINKKWKLDTVKEIIIKRYNLVRQAVEIYFENSTSVFISFFSETYLKQFLKTIEEAIKKKPRNIEIIKEPDQYFAMKKYREKWIKSEISNFDYLMLLNKYGGRTFHDLNQYPVFPWIISDYHSQTLDLSNPGVYRPLGTPIAAISAEKKLAANRLVLTTEGEAEPKTHQFEPHYLNSNIVLSYLLRLEPYASLLLNTDLQEELPLKVFHILSDVWYKCNTEVTENKELIPEFFYLPEMFGNYNYYSFGMSNFCRVDQTVLPLWARNHHHFVQLNTMALENRHVSYSLHEWIDLIFGDKQNDPKYFNQFNKLCDEKSINCMTAAELHTKIPEMQNLGCNPIKLFKDKHPPKDKAEYEKKFGHALFSPENANLNRPYGVVHAYTFKSAITQIYAYDSRVIVITSDQKVFKTNDEYLNVAHEKPIMFEKKERHVSLFPYKKMFVEGSSYLSCDARKSIISLEQGNFLITCRHYDNSCKIINSANGEVLQHLHFHKTFVFTICANRDKKTLYSGSLDGVVAKWDISTYKTQPVQTEWYVCDHKLAVITLDAIQELDLVASGSLDGTISIRIGSSGKFVRIIKPDLFLGEMDYAINQIRISYRGYILILARCKYPRLELSDYFLVYSINGEFIAKASSDDLINAIVLDETGYQFIAGGKTGKIYRVDLLSLSSHDILEDLDAQLPDVGKILHHFLSTTTAITAMELTRQENFQQLLIGLSTGELYSLKYSPRVTSGRLFDNLQGLIISK